MVVVVEGGEGGGAISPNISSISSSSRGMGGVDRGHTLSLLHLMRLLGGMGTGHPPPLLGTGSSSSRGGGDMVGEGMVVVGVVGGVLGLLPGIRYILI